MHWSNKRYQMNSCHIIRIVSQISCAEGQNSSEDYIGRVYVYVYYDR